MNRFCLSAPLPWLLRLLAFALVCAAMASSWELDFLQLMKSESQMQRDNQKPLEPAETLVLLKQLANKKPTHEGFFWRETQAIEQLIELDQIADDEEKCGEHEFKKYNWPLRFYGDEPNPRMYALHQTKRHCAVCVAKFHASLATVEAQLSQEEQKDLELLLSLAKEEPSSYETGLPKVNSLPKIALQFLEAKLGGSLSGKFSWPNRKSKFEAAYKSNILDFCAGVATKVSAHLHLYEGFALVSEHCNEIPRDNDLKWTLGAKICKDLVLFNMFTEPLAYRSFKKAKKGVY